MIHPHTIRATETDIHQKARPTAVCNLLQEIAGLHAHENELGYVHMAAIGAVWMLNRLTVVIDRYPVWKEPVQVHTWVWEMNGPFSHRDYAIKSESGETLVRGSSRWVLIDRKTRRPKRMGDWEAVIPILESQQAIGGPPEKLPALQGAEEVDRRAARFSELDMIGHVNNGVYVAWLMDSYDLAFHESHEVEKLEVNFLGETHFQHDLRIDKQALGNLSNLHAIQNLTTGREAVRARLTWRERH